MKTKIFLIAVIIFSSNYKCQDLGIDLNIGYSKLLMEDVNNYLDNSESIGFDNLNQIPLLGSGFYAELGVSARLSQLTLKLTLNYISDEGNWYSSSIDKTITQDISVSTLEILPAVVYSISIFEKASIILEGALGYSFAASDINYIVSTHYPSSVTVQTNTYSLNGGYFMARLRGGLEANLKFVLLRFVIGYRFANPVVLTGESNINGVIKDDVPIIKDDGSKLEFDFSGFNYQWGITILL
jgi:hypothetical protein